MKTRTLLFGLALCSAVMLMSQKSFGLTKAKAQDVFGATSGDYKISNTKSNVKDEMFCDDEGIQKLEWSGTEDRPLLKIGGQLQFNHIDEGLIIDSQPYYDDNCVYNRNSQLEKGKISGEVFTNCSSYSKTEHTVIESKENELHYSYTVKFVIKGKSKTSKSSCVLKKV